MAVRIMRSQKVSMEGSSWESYEKYLGWRVLVMPKKGLRRTVLKNLFKVESLWNTAKTSMEESFEKVMESI